MTWETISFSRAFSDVTAKSPRIKQSEFAKTGRYPVRDQGEQDIAGYWDDDSAVTKVGTPLILFGDHTRRVKYTDTDFVIGADGVKVLLPSAEMDPRFAFHWMSSLEIPSAGYSRHFKFLRERLVPLPPLPEQRRIAAILDEAGTLRARAVSQLMRLDEVEDRAFDSLLGGSVGASVTLGDVTEGLRYGTSVKSGSTGLPVLRIPNITGRSVDASDLKTVELSSAETDRLRLTDRDVLFVRSNGNPDVVGRCSAFSSLEASARGSSDWVFASYLIRARLRPGVDPHAIAALARSAVGRRHLRAGAATSAGQYNVNTAVLRSLPAFDSAHPAQTTFGSISRNIDAQRVKARHVINELGSLVASLQHLAFRGEL